MDEEATGRVIISVTPEVIKPIGGVRRNLTGKASPKGSPSFSNSDEKPLPRYLQSNIKSCHDFCKYGRKHDFEGKEKHSFLRRSRKNLVTVEQSQKKALNFGERGKKPVSQLKSSFKQKIELSVESKVINPNPLSTTKGPRFVKNPVNKELQTLSAGLKNVESGKQANLPSSPKNKQIKLKSLNTSARKERETIKQKTMFRLKTFLNKRKVFGQKDMSCSNEVDACGKSGTMKEKAVFTSKKGIASVNPKLLRQISVKKPVTAAKPIIIKQRASLPPKSIGILDKPEISLQAKKTSVVKSLSPLTHPAGLASRGNREDKITKSLGMTKVGEKKVLKPSTASWPIKSAGDGTSNLKPWKYRKTKLMTPVKCQENDERTAHASGEKVEKGEHDMDGNEEKILYVIEPKAENVDLGSFQQIFDGHQTLDLMPHDEEEVEEVESLSEFSQSSESLFDDVGTGNKSRDEFPKGEDRRRLRRTAAVHPEVKTPPSYKLKFRRGRIIEPQAESNGPRRLIFRRGRMVGENTHDHRLLGRRSFRRRTGLLVSNDPNPDARGVVLRHQNTWRKKESQSLFNNVIEETASKLVETRKSKVKALVGAFETVISLQDNKPASMA